MQNKKGFTLIELMIVVAIIAILAMIAVPLYQRYLERARNSATQSNLKNLALAEEAFNVDYQTYTTSMSALTRFGFRPDRNVKFSTITLGDVRVNNATVASFSVGAVHKSSTAQFIYDNARGTGVMPRPGTSGHNALSGNRYSADGSITTNP